MTIRVSQIVVAAVTAAIVATGVVACASYAPYGPATAGGRVGYFDQAVENDRYRISYRGPSGMGRNEVEDLAMLRAADLTLERGYDWFQVVNRFGEVAAPTTPRFSFGVGGGSFGRSSAVGMSTGTGFGGEPTFVANLEIIVGKGDKPATTDTYNARSVAQVIRPRAPR